MSETTYCVVFKGEISAGSNIEEVKEKVSKAFNVDASKIEQLFSGKRMIVKKNASHEECEAMKKIFEDAGAIACVEQETETDMEIQGPPPLPGPEKRQRIRANDSPVKQADEKFCSNCGSVIKIKSLSCPRCGQKQKKDGMGCLPMAAIGLAICFVGIIVLGIIAAIAIPQFHAYRTRAYQASVKEELKEVCMAEENYFANNNTYTDSLEELGYISKPNISIQIVETGDDCFQAMGEMQVLQKRYFIDCNCEITEEEIINE
ncbi:MAG: hypothetical protein PVG39_07830 [Desulfobacteraceae bacterium]|jgi:Tfp pilus assembly protein PilE